MAKSKNGKSETVVIVYPRNTIELTVSAECADQMLAFARKRNRITDSAEFSGVDVNGQKFRVQMGSPALAVYARSKQPNVIVVTKRSDDIHVYLKGDTRIWGAGKSQYEAIGNLITLHGDIFNTQVETA